VIGIGIGEFPKQDIRRAPKVGEPLHVGATVKTPTSVRCSAYIYSIRNWFTPTDTFSFQHVFPTSRTALVMAPIIFITGANRGIGFCIAQVLARQKSGSTILVTARTQSSASEAIQKLMASGAHGTLEPMALDVTSDDSMHALVAMIKEKHGRLDGKYTIKMAMLPHTTLTRPHSSHQQCRNRSCSECGPSRLSSGLQLSLGHNSYLGRPLDFTSDASAASVKKSKSHQHLFWTCIYRATQFRRSTSDS
jgi:hypothetical protein